MKKPTKAKGWRKGVCTLFHADAYIEVVSHRANGAPGTPQQGLVPSKPTQPRKSSLAHDDRRRLREVSYSLIKAISMASGIKTRRAASILRSLRDLHGQVTQLLEK